MNPQLFGLPSWLLLWSASAVFAIPTGMYLARRAGFPPVRSLSLLIIASLTFLIGSKLLYLVEMQVWPLELPALLAAGSAGGVGAHGFRIPGGMLLLAPVAPLACRLFRFPTLRFVDAVFPVLGLSIFFIRMGCFMNGCCFGRVSGLPWAMSFPRGALVYDWHMAEGLIRWPVLRSLPVHPLQLYFALVGLALFVLGLGWQARKRYDGEVWANFYLGFFGSSFVLEFVRGYRLPVNMILEACVVAVTAVIVMRAQRALNREYPRPT